MDRDLARKAPAQTITSTTLTGAHAVIGGKTMQEVELKANHLFRQGKIEADYTLRWVNAQRWEATVKLAPRPSWLRRNRSRLIFIPAGGLAALAAGYFLVQALVIAVAALIPYAIGAALIMAAGSLVAGPRVIEVVQRVTIRR